MPIFKDENDFPDVEAPVADRRLFSNEVVGSYPKGNGLEYGLEARPARQLDVDVASQANRLPSRKLDESDDADDFVEIVRPDDARRNVLSRSKPWPSTLWGASARTKTASMHRQAFANASEVLPCIERRVRREVLFARRRAGKRGAHFPRRRRTPWSGFRC